MPTVKIWIDCYMASVALASIYFCALSIKKIWRVGPVRYSVTLFFTSMAWPLFIGKEYY